MPGIKGSARPGRVSEMTLMLLQYIRENQPVIPNQAGKPFGLKSNSVLQRLTTLESSGILFALDVKNRITIFKDNPEIILQNDQKEK
jgi:hypothetical protein